MINDEQLHKWINGTLSEEELKVFQLRPEYDSLIDVFENTNGLSVPKFDEDKMLAKILQEEKKKVSPDKGRRFFLSSWAKYGVAASILLLAAWLFWPQSDMVKYDLAQGERTEATLPDGSKFILNAESKLSYNKETWSTNRVINLEGEAFFEVKKGSKFSVYTPKGSVNVLGTKFNVRSRNNFLDVKCQSGKVEVVNLDGNVLGELIANDAIRVSDKGNIEKWKTVPSEKADWVNGVFKFKNVALKIVLEELERQYQVKVDVKNIDSKDQISTSFQKGNLELALKTILTPLGISYEKVDSQNIILK